MLLEKPVFKMYVKNGCPYCDKARDLILNDLRASLHLINVSDQTDLRKLIIKETGQKTVPVVYVGDNFVGGCDDLFRLNETGELQLLALKAENEILIKEVMRLRGNE
tara:strand:- start:2798 stop:3118 length:321 start_codon:yes stop_codon:yes gene_type:complete